VPPFEQRRPRFDHRIHCSLSDSFIQFLQHCQNLNGRLDTNWLGIPREGVDASNNPKSRMGPPKFAAAEFQHSGASIDVEIIMHYV